MDDPKVADDLLISFNLSRDLKNYDRAEVILGRVMGIHRQAYGASSVELADDFSRLAHMCLEKNLLIGISLAGELMELRTLSASELAAAVRFMLALSRIAGIEFAEDLVEKRMRRVCQFGRGSTH